MSVISDLIEQASVTLNSKGYEVTRSFMVTSVGGSPDSRIYNAIMNPNIPKPPVAHPSIPGVYAFDVSGSVVDKDTIKVTVKYKGLDSADKPPNDTEEPQIEVGANMVQEETNYNIAGEQIFVTHTWERENEEGILETIGPKRQNGTVSIQVPQVFLRFSRREVFSPEAKSRMYSGKVNLNPWRGDPARTWLCLGIVGRSDDGGASYNVEYNFLRKANTWDATIVFVDPDTNEIPEDLVEGVGIKHEMVYEMIDFSGVFS